MGFSTSDFDDRGFSKPPDEPPFSNLKAEYFQMAVKKMYVDQPVNVYNAENSLEAHAVSNLLEAADIRAMVIGDQMAVVQGAVPFGDATSPQVVVAASDQIRAREIVAEWDQQQIKRDRKHQPPPLQFGMRLLLVNMTLVALLFGLHPFLGAETWAELSPSLFMFLLLGNLLTLAYRRQNSRQARTEKNSNPFAE